MNRLLNLEILRKRKITQVSLKSYTPANLVTRSKSVTLTQSFTTYTESDFTLLYPKLLIRLILLVYLQCKCRIVGRTTQNHLRKKWFLHIRLRFILRGSSTITAQINFGIRNSTSRLHLFYNFLTTKYGKSRK